MTQRVPSYYDNIVEDHSYTMFSTYPPTANVVDHWQIMHTKDENAMVRVRLILQYSFGRGIGYSRLTCTIVYCLCASIIFYLVSDT